MDSIKKVIGEDFMAFMEEEYDAKFVDVTPDAQDFGPGPMFDAVSKALANHNRRRLMMFEKYIHTNECSDEGGWFAFFQPEGQFDEDVFGQRVNGFETEEAAIKALIQKAVRR